MKDSGIQWTTHTFNPWRGCTKVSAGCANCYAETLSKRNPKTLGTWGPNGTRIVAAKARWKEVLDWNAEALANFENWQFAVQSARSEYDAVAPYERPRVFCASLADVFETWNGPMSNAGGEKLWKAWNSDRIEAAAERPYPRFSPLTMQDVRTRLFELIDKTPALDWLLLTKRPENLNRMLPVEFIDDGGDCNDPEERAFFAQGRVNKVLPNAWLGTTVENRTALERIDVLRSIPAAVRFLSCEPLLEDLGTLDLTGIHWVIVGGESGHGSRPFNLEWARSIVAQCRAAGVAVFVKQLGAQPIEVLTPGIAPGSITLDTYDMPGGEPDDEVQPLKLIDRRKGGDMYEWPRDLQVREFPAAKVGAA